MTHAKKLIVPTLCVLFGCAGGAAMGRVTAQTWPEPVNVQRWQIECQNIGGTMRGTNAALRTRGEAGWDLVTQEGGQYCFKRPAP